MEVRLGGGNGVFSHGTNHSKGVAIMFGADLDLQVEQLLMDNEGRYVFIKGQVQGERMILGNIYSPTRDKEQVQCDFFLELDRVLSTLAEDGYKILMGGDFNVLMNMALDYFGSRIVTKTKSRDVLMGIMDKFDLIDIWRKRNPNKKQFTFRKKNPVVQTRLDYIFVSSTLENEVKNCEILISVTPDHSSISLSLGGSNTIKDYGKSYWKFNSSLCLDNEFVNKVNYKIKELERTWGSQIASKVILWDFVKMKLREFIMKYSCEKAKLRKENIEKLEMEIRDLEHQMLVTPTKMISDKVDEKKKDLEKLHDFTRQGAKVRSRAPWSEEGEKNIEYFEQLLKSNKKRSVICEIYDNDMNILKDKNKILKIIRQFYENLYASKEQSEDIREYGFYKNIKKLSEDSKLFCEGKMTVAECYNALKELKWNKSPGNDGFTAEFYCTFWPALGDLIVGALNEAFDRGELSNSQKQGVITLIEKEGKDNLHIKNYRPITLLNVDYKILSKVLAKRIKEVLGEIIYVDQVGYIKNRNIGEAVRLIDDMFFYSLNRNIGFLAAIDFEKAFDSISHDFLLHVLKVFGFGDSFCEWIKILYTDIRSCVMNGGHSTGYFNIERGVRQGDPLSPYLFVLAIEILTLCIRKDDNIKGIKLGQSDIKQVLYADDITLFLQDRKSIERVQQILEAFEKISGLKVNKEKTNFVWLGKETERSEIQLFGNLVEEVKILGIYFTRNLKRKDDLNYKEILSKIKRLVGWWKQRDLTIMGKIQLLKTYVLSKFNYVSSLITVPKVILEEVERISFDFIWNGKDRIKRKIFYQDYEFGGMRMTNYDTFIKAQRIMWLKRLLYGGNYSGWKISFDFFARAVGGRFIFLCDYDYNKMNLKSFPPFYKEMLKVWQGVDKCRHFEENKKNPIIFNNRHICIRNKMIFDEELLKKGIVQINDIVEGIRMKPYSYFWNLGIESKGLLKIYDMFKAIPNDWRMRDQMQVDTNNFDIKVKIGGQIGTLSSLKSKVLYNHLITQFQEDYNLQIRDGYNQYNYDKEEIKEIFLRIKRTILCCKYREFQYKLLHGALYTKVHLHRFGFVPEKLCSFCKQEEETYPHLFLLCEQVKRIWHEIINTLNLEEIDIDNWSLIFIGIQGNSHRIKMCNSIIFIIKYIVYSSRTKGVLPSINDILKIIIDYRDREKELATKTGKIGLHLMKWQELNI